MLTLSFDLGDEGSNFVKFDLNLGVSSIDGSILALQSGAISICLVSPKPAYFRIGLAIERSWLLGYFND